MACPCCGRDDEPAVGDPLVAACDVLVIRALELVGKRLVRLDRSRYQRMDGRPWHEAHILWQADRPLVDKALGDAWTSVPAVVAEHGCCQLTAEQLCVVLDRYTRDCIDAMAGHDVGELRVRLGAYLGLPIR